MLFFGIINIPLFKYFCEIPNLDYQYSIFTYLSSELDTIKNEYIYFYFENLYIINKNISLYYNNFYIFNYFQFYLNLYSKSYYYIFNIFDDKYSNFFKLYYLNNITSQDYIEIVFKTSSTNYNFIEFICLQSTIFIIPYETHLIFFRIYNSIEYDFTGISIYLVFPIDYLLYFNKIQCFCFEEIFLFPLESIDLPVIFNIIGNIKYDLDFFYSNCIYLSYLFLIK